MLKNCCRRYRRVRLLSVGTIDSNVDGKRPYSAVFQCIINGRSDYVAENVAAKVVGKIAEKAYKGRRQVITALGIRVKNNTLLSINFLDPLTHPLSYQTHVKLTNNKKQPIRGYVSEVVDQLDRYFKDPTWRFTINLGTNGTEFQQLVWQQLKKIPVGKKSTYGELARRISSSPRRSEEHTSELQSH